MKKSSYLNATTMSAAFTSLCIILFSISCSKEQSSIAPPPPPPPPPPQSISVSLFSGQVPTDTTQNDNYGNGIVLGLKFRTNIAGTIDGLRFYKTHGNAGEHVGLLYSVDGTLLASAAFTNETDTGWQTATLSQPVSISVNTTYIGAYYSSLGNYVSTNYGLKNAVTNPPLTALADSTDGPNGLFKYTSSFLMPDQGYMSNNYWVDVILTYQKSE
ncbi:MAG: DUF4082 domain-containing protein [Chitinophagales bacterium]